MNACSENTIDLDQATSSLVVALASEKTDHLSTAALVTIERLRRLEEDARFAGTTRQALQKIASARRLLGDRGAYRRFDAPLLVK